MENISTNLSPQRKGGLSIAAKTDMKALGRKGGIASGVSRRGKSMGQYKQAQDDRVEKV